MSFLRGIRPNRGGTVNTDLLASVKFLHWQDLVMHSKNLIETKCAVGLSVCGLCLWSVWPGLIISLKQENESNQPHHLLSPLQSMSRCFSPASHLFILPFTHPVLLSFFLCHPKKALPSWLFLQQPPPYPLFLSTLCLLLDYWIFYLHITPSLSV